MTWTCLAGRTIITSCWRPVSGADAGDAGPGGPRALDPKGFTWIVVGDAAKVRPQLEKLGMPIEVVEAP